MIVVADVGEVSDYGGSKYPQGCLGFRGRLIVT